MAKFSSDASIFLFFYSFLFPSSDLYHEQVFFFFFFRVKAWVREVVIASPGCEFEFGSVCLKLPLLIKMGCFYIITR